MRLALCAVVLSSASGIVMHNMLSEEVENAGHPTNGIVFIKTPKTGGSTLGGVIRRIGLHFNLEHVFDDGPSFCHGKVAPAVYAHHGARREMTANLSSALPGAFYVTIVRDPVERCMSEFYYVHVARKNETSTDKKKIKFLKKCGGNNQSEYTAKVGDQPVRQILSSYDFIALTDRFDESLLVLSRKLNVSKNAILYLGSKISGNNATYGTQEVYIPPHPKFEEESKAVHVAARKVRNGSDSELVAKANSALDKIIQEYGPTFQTDLGEFKHRLAYIEQTCRTHYADSCLWRDNGCAQDCINNLIVQHNWN